MEQVTPGIWRSRGITKSRRLRYSASMSGTESCDPFSASTAAFCAIDVGFEVEWLCSFIIAPIIGSGASPYPMRHPVIAYVFDAVPATSTIGFEPAIDATEYGFASYKKCE